MQVRQHRRMFGRPDLRYPRVLRNGVGEPGGGVHTGGAGGVCGSDADVAERVAPAGDGSNQ
jgi:hypothetical protein